MEKVTATSILEIITICPYCEAIDDNTSELTEHLDVGELRAESCSAIIQCSECKKDYEVTEIVF